MSVITNPARLLAPASPHLLKIPVPEERAHELLAHYTFHLGVRAWLGETRTIHPSINCFNRWIFLEADIAPEYRELAATPPVGFVGNYPQGQLCGFSGNALYSDFWTALTCLLTLARWDKREEMGARKVQAHWYPLTPPQRMKNDKGWTYPLLRREPMTLAQLFPNGAWATLLVPAKAPSVVAQKTPPPAPAAMPARPRAKSQQLAIF